MAEQSSFLHPKSASQHESDRAQEQDHGISIDLPPGQDGRPPPVKHLSAPAYHSPIRHHRRAPSRTKGVKETLNAQSHYGSTDDASVHRINQYIIKQEIGRGSFGAVHLAVDQYGQEYAVKEFSKSRLRKRAQSNLLRKPNAGRRPGHIAAGTGFNAPLHLGPSGKTNASESNNSLSLIKEEIAIMKKLNHNNLVALIEVLDDPQEDSLYMVLEMCKKGVAMHVGLDERAQPYDDETCRCWFRDMILGIEYLHAQGIIHRDIKPDNCLITSDDVLKIVDFGVSEMFEKQSEMATAKSAGSPAFMPPELCVAKHGQISGKAADIWSMGVTLYCLRYGHIPFEKGSMLELYESIREDSIPLDEENDANFADLMRRLLEKDPEKRITMSEIREHPWVTKGGKDKLLSAEENCADLVEPPTESEMEHAITGNMVHLLAVVRAAKRFKRLVDDKRGRFMEGILGRDSRVVAPPSSIRRSRSNETDDRNPLDQLLAASGVHREYDADAELQKMPSNLEHLNMFQSPEVDVSSSLDRELGESPAHHKQRMETAAHHPDTHDHPHASRAMTFPVNGTAKGQAHDPLEDTLFLDIGVDPEAGKSHVEGGYPVVSESPPAVDMNIYEQAYEHEMQRILERRGREPSMYLTRRIDHRDDIRSLANVKDAGKQIARAAAAKLGDVSRQSYSAGQGIGDIGTLAAKGAADKASETWTNKSGTRSDYMSSLKEGARSAASVGYVSASKAGEKLNDLYARTGRSNTSEHSSSAGKGFSGLVTRAQAKYRNDQSEPGYQSSDQEHSAVDSAAVENGGSKRDESSVPEKHEDATAEGRPVSSNIASAPTTSVPAGLPLESAFKEHIP